MMRNGEWGTDREIVAAANLFNCSIVCCSRYGGSNRLCLQLFSPHMMSGGECVVGCKHSTLFIVNIGVSHYDLVVVRQKNCTEE